MKLKKRANWSTLENSGLKFKLWRGFPKGTLSSGMHMHTYNKTKFFKEGWKIFRGNFEGMLNFNEESNNLLGKFTVGMCHFAVNRVTNSFKRKHLRLHSHSLEEFC